MKQTLTLHPNAEAMRLKTAPLPAVLGVGSQYDREAPAGLPNGQVILGSDPHNCGFTASPLHPQRKTMNFHYSSHAYPFARRTTLLALAATAAFITGCATPTGQVFNASAKPPEGQAQVYVYLKSPMPGHGSGFDVKLDQQHAADLLSNAYVQLPVTAGEHVLGVTPPLAKTFTQNFTAQPGNTYYFEFELPPMLLANVFYLGASLTPRDAAKAQADMAGLKGVK
jgi:hypothetical protein